MTKTKKAKHTPLPWHRAGDMIYFGNTLVAMCGPTDSPEATANLDLIVRAVNSHEDLLEACKAALNQTGDEVTLLRAAIAKAEAE